MPQINNTWSDEDKKEFRDLIDIVERGNTLCCYAKLHSPDFKSYSNNYFYVFESSEGKLYYWPDIFKRDFARPVYQRIESAFGHAVTLELSGTPELKPCFDNVCDNVLVFRPPGN